MPVYLPLARQKSTLAALGLAMICHFGSAAALPAMPTCEVDILRAPPSGKVSSAQLMAAHGAIAESAPRASEAAAVALGSEGLVHKLSRYARSAFAYFAAPVNPLAVAESIRSLNLTGGQRLDLARQVAKADFLIFLQHAVNFGLTKKQIFETFEEFGPLWLSALNQRAPGDDRPKAPVVLWTKPLVSLDFDEPQRVRLALAMMKFVPEGQHPEIVADLNIQSRAGVESMLAYGVTRNSEPLMQAIAAKSLLSPNVWFSSFMRASQSKMRLATIILIELKIPITIKDRLTMLREVLNDEKFESVIEVGASLGITNLSDLHTLSDKFTDTDQLEILLRTNPSDSALFAKMTQLEFTPARGRRLLLWALAETRFDLERLVALPATWGRMEQIRRADWRTLSEVSTGKLIAALRRYKTLNNGTMNWPAEEFLRQMPPERRAPILDCLVEMGFELNDPTLLIGLPKIRQRAFATAQAAPRSARSMTVVAGLSSRQVFELGLSNLTAATEYGFGRFSRVQREQLLTAMVESEDLFLPATGLSDLSRSFRINLALRMIARREHSRPREKLLWDAKFNRTDLLLQLGSRPIEVLNAKRNESVTLQTPSADMARAIREYARINSDILPETTLRTILSLPNSSTMIAMLRLSAAVQLSADRAVIFSSPMELVAAALGIPLDVLAHANFGQIDLPTLLILTDEIVRTSTMAVFSQVRFEPTLFANKKNHAAIIKFLGLVRDCLALTKNPSESLQWILAEMSGAVTLDRITSAIPKLQTRVVDLVRAILEDPSFAFSYDDLQRLQTEWGDLEPIYTLLGRYRSNPAWKKEVPVVTRIFQHSLAGNFKRYKFYGDSSDREDREKAQHQLQMLDPARIEALSRVLSHVSVSDGKAGDSAPLTSEQKIAQAHQVITTNLIPNLGYKGVVAAALPSVDRSFAEAMTHSNPAQWAQALATPNQERAALGGLASLMHRARAIGQITFLAKTALAMVQKNMIPDFSGNQVVETKADLTEVIGKLTQGQQGGERAITFTTTVEHPRSLIATGDLVQSSSCQNYKTGGVIQTLPGYVIDANVLVMVGYALTPSQFATAREFEAIYGAIADGIRVQARLDEIRKIITFGWSDARGAHQVSTIQISYAQHRQVIKIGARLDDLTKPALFAERPYTQVHFANTALAREANRLVHALARRIHAAVDVPMRVFGSRNDGGHYSDAAGGAKTSDYDIRPAAPAPSPDAP